VYPDEEGMINLCENIPFHHDAFDLVLLLDVFLLHRLDGEKLPRVLATHEDHFCIGALADDRKHCVCVEG